MVVNSPNLVNYNDFSDSPRYALDFILSQEGIDKTLLLQNDLRNVGIACACAPEKADCPSCF